MDMQNYILNILDIADVRNSFATCVYETRNDDFLRKTAISDRKVKLSDRFPNGVRKVQTMRGTCGMSLDYERKVKAQCARQGADGSQFIAQTMSGLEWLDEKYVGLVCVNKERELILRWYPMPNVKPEVHYYHGDEEITWADLADFHPAERKPYNKVFLNEKGEPVVVDMPSVRALKFNKILNLKVDGIEINP